MVMRQVVDLGGLLVSAFVVNLALSLLTLAILRWLMGWFDLWRFVWDPPLAQFGILICLLGLYTLIL
ncbi:hypothetical protein Gbth_025_034 [Gluconobacter thailandicus F149-1 = NBRC 100600]|jgi:hypothetical protein|uniref:DUF1656 domain-containing protein n=2 Tax=Gluconobacter thailandicus TaxID=257438 RepID=A0AAP9EQ44_GLUTH|nr:MULTISPECIES: DUF1656 domain-containing protein [Gluconobacter]OAG74137.1 hypothetical protein A0J51_00490 [Gluconobacter japonicus]GAN90399.1 hypothetical protein Gbfr_014_033 [Gluconobacter frateurii M-2]QEH95511.1 DUF1656 domain-containing protein [Gluconobacter thailandicus]UMM09231.1 DUF1656 domain-containing protein [Gluconobacter frateurii]GAN93569.1 hypothetical protein Gbth_025_034 [Gluconobacter thailandicus F149-1 = NBRC 100600]